MTLPIRSLGTILVALALGGCKSHEGSLEQQSKQCESRCAQIQQDCSADPAFADPWSLACEVACNLDAEDDTRPFATCMDAASSCDEQAACVDAGPGGSSGATAADTNGSHGEDGPGTTGGTSGPPGSTSGAEDTGSPTTNGGSTGGEVGPACCDVSGAPCPDPDVQACTCENMPSCCEGTWGEVCAGIAVANGCIPEGCPSLDGRTEWNCTCSTTDVSCPDDPFTSQLIFGTDACASDEADALAAVQAACEQGDGSCSVGAGSCDCTCSDSGDTCGPTG